MKFEKWIDLKTPRQVARALDVDQATVWHWHTKKSCPKPRTMKRLIELSDGKLNYNDIVEHFLTNK